MNRQGVCQLRERARRGINDARRLRKYVQRGNLTAVEQAALSALVDVERLAGELLEIGGFAGVGFENGSGIEKQ